MTPLSILGSAGAYYTGSDFGAVDGWRHNAVGIGDIDVRIAGGRAHNEEFTAELCVKTSPPLSRTDQIEAVEAYTLPAGRAYYGLAQLRQVCSTSGL